MVDLTNPDIIDWDVNMVSDVFKDVSARAIKWPSCVSEDKLVWIQNGLGLFSVKESYNVNCSRMEDKSPFWNQLWK